MRQRILDLDLEDVIILFADTRWKFMSKDDDRGLVKIEVPRGMTDESFIIELYYEDVAEKEKIVNKLLGADFIFQSKRTTQEW